MIVTEHYPQLLAFEVSKKMIGHMLQCPQTSVVEVMYHFYSDSDFFDQWEFWCLYFVVVKVEPALVREVALWLIIWHSLFDRKPLKEIEHYSVDDDHVKF